ncbi:MAG: DNA repair protein RecO [Alphaproteobacteria bacterium]|nr:DNA repair protein RecO [Alphaproteobacteria bacterium]
MEWIDEAIVLSARPHGENAAVVMLLTETQGRHAGLMAGGQGQRAQPVLQPGNRVKARWRAKLEDHLGHYSCDLLNAHPAAWLDEPEILALIASACAVTEASLPERQPMLGVYAGLCALLALPDPGLWGPSYIKWEMGLLQALGYGLDLNACAANGGSDNLAYVSPRTGRAVSLEAGAPYHEKLFPLPSFLAGRGLWTSQDIRQGLELTGHFLARHVFAHPQNRHLIARPGDLPLARQRLLDYYPPQPEERLESVAS